MTKPVLIVEDDPLQRQMLSTLLMRKMDYGVHTAKNGREALDIVDADIENTIKIIILDLEMPVMNGVETLEILKQRHPHIPVIMLTGSKDVESVAKVMKLGAMDFIAKPYDANRMMITIKNALKLSLLSKEVGRLKGEKDRVTRFDSLIGHDQGLLQAVTLARKAALSDIPILITGETGTGKEIFANALPGESARTGQPFIAINCGAIPAQLIESTLFGHEKGAFTGATERAIGKFREAEGGTIFLDEVGELPLDAQVKLLRVLQQKEVEPVGGARPVPVNVRIISATNRDLAEDVKDYKFREDLFFRLNVLELSLPALRDRPQDIAALAHHFIERYCVHHNSLPKTLSRDAIHALTMRAWPGNVRELENALNRAMVVADGNILEPIDFHSIHGNAEKNIGSRPDLPDQTAISQAYGIDMLGRDGNLKTALDIEKEAMSIALSHFDGNVTQSAKALGMAKSTFYKKRSKM